MAAKRESITFSKITSSKVDQKITLSKISSSKVIKLIKKSVIDHFVKRYLGHFGVLPMAHYL